MNNKISQVNQFLDWAYGESYMSHDDLQDVRKRLEIVDLTVKNLCTKPDGKLTAIGTFYIWWSTWMWFRAMKQTGFRHK